MALAAACQSEVADLKHVLLKHVEDAFVDDERIAGQWRGLGYTAPPDLQRARLEYDAFVATLEGFGVGIDYLPRAEHCGLDSLYVRDASVVTHQGVVLCNMGKALRRHEPHAQASWFRARGLRILGAIEGEGRLEGGDVAWTGPRTLAVGHGYRTNAEGIRQLQRLVGDSVDEIIVVPLPHWRGPEDVFHLMSILSPIDDALALVYSPLLPVPFRETLLERGFGLVEVPEAEFETMACNVLAVAPGKCLMLAGNPETRRRLERAGAEVHEYQGREISTKGGGGPTCLTRPLLRSA